jgi:hypothetical protein
VTDLTVTAGSSLNVTGSISIAGLLRVYYPMTILAGNALNLGADSYMHIHITVLPTVMTAASGKQFITIPLTMQGSLNGAMTNVTAEMNYAVARSTGQPCYVATNSTPVYSQSTLSVVVDVQSCDGGGLSTGAIVGIAVGAAAGGVLLIVILAVVVS